MVRKAMPVVVCLAALLLGCEKKEPPTAPPVRVVPPRQQAPAGMVPIRDGVPIFISEKPVSVGQHLAYLTGTGQLVPSQWQDVEPDSEQADLPVRGLSRQEAERCAVWHRRRLPTAQEWAQATAVGARPYPWSEGGLPVAPEAEFYFLRHWRPGSDAEVAAARAKAGLVESIAAENAEQIQGLRGELQALVDAQKVGREDSWQQLKAAFFALLDREKQAAELAARSESQFEVMQILNRLALAKGKLAANIKAAELTGEETEEAVNAYESLLTETRTKTLDVRERLQGAVAAQQEEVLTLTKAFEEAGAAELTVDVDEAESILAQSAQPPADTAQAGELMAALKAAVEHLRAAAPAFAAMPDAAEIEARAAELDEEIELLAGDKPLAETIQATADKLDRFSQAAGREFVQEKLLLQELADLVELRANRKGVEARLDGLRTVLGVESPPEAE